MLNSKPLKILIIDDNTLTQDVLSLLLKEKGYEIIGLASDGETGLELAFSTNPDLIFLDVHLPRTSGFEVLKQIMVWCPTATVIMLSGSDDETAVKLTRQIGAVGYMTKPFTDECLQKTITEVLQARKPVTPPRE